MCHLSQNSLMDLERKGLLAFSFGMAKKVLLADVYGRVVNWGFTNIPVMGSTNGIIAMVAYTLQIYSLILERKQYINYSQAMYNSIVFLSVYLQERQCAEK